jgi:hypothetical protein
MRTPTRRSYPDLLTWRTTQGFNIDQAAKFLQMERTKYWRFECRIQPATGQTAKYLMDRCGVSLEWLVGIA